jgi:ATP-dependent exoDNAse (exonuclease V) beta subunit
VGPPRLSPSAAGEQGSLPAARPVEDGGAYVDRATALALGALVHAALELGWDAGALAAEAERLRLSGAERAFAADCAERARAMPFAERRRAARRALAEYPLAFDEGGVRVRGAIDLLLADAQGALEVVDYKTDRIAPEGARARAEHHLPQLALYALGLERAGHAVRRLTVAFLAAGVEESFDWDAAARAAAQAALAAAR